MHKVLYGIAAMALVIAVLDLQSPPGSRAELEAGILLVLAPILAGAGWIGHRARSKVCPQCRERISARARRCPRCTAELERAT